MARASRKRAAFSSRPGVVLTICQAGVASGTISARNGPTFGRARRRSQARGVRGRRWMVCRARRGLMLGWPRLAFCSPIVFRPAVAPCRGALLRRIRPVGKRRLRCHPPTRPGSTRSALARLATCTAPSGSSRVPHSQRTTKLRETLSKAASSACVRARRSRSSRSRASQAVGRTSMPYGHPLSRMAVDIRGAVAASPGEPSRGADVYGSSPGGARWPTSSWRWSAWPSAPLATKRWRRGWDSNPR